MDIETRAGTFQVQVLTEVVHPDAQVTVIIVNSLTSQMTLNALASFRKFNDIPTNYVVVDNFSDQSVLDALVQETGKFATILSNHGEPKSIKLGHWDSLLNAIGLDIGSRFVQTPLGFVCHNDVLACRPGWLRHLTERLTEKCRGASFSQDNDRIRAMHVSGYLYDTVIYSHQTSFWYPIKGKWVLSRRRIAKRYSESWLWLDLPGSVPVELIDEDGLLQFRTRPWCTAEQFLNHRTNFDKWVKTGNTPRTVDDYQRFQQWKGRSHRGKRKVQQAYTDFEMAVIIMFAQGSCGLTSWDPKLRLGLSMRKRAEILTAAGLPITKRALEAHALKNLAPIEGTVLALTKRDEVLWEKLEAIIGGAPLLRLLAI